MKIKFLYHSGIALETEDMIVLFDPIKHYDHYRNKKIYCFISHSHGDHYDPNILKLQDRNDVTYIVSEDIETIEGAYVVKKGDQVSLNDLSFTTYGTTDLGVSYLVDLKGQRIFHSGDLNWWHWPDNTKEKQLNEENQYKDELKFLEGQKVDYAFVPVDPRLKEGHNFSMKYFIETIQPEFFIPIHFGQAFDFIQKIKSENAKVLLPSQENELLSEGLI